MTVATKKETKLFISANQTITLVSEENDAGNEVTTLMVNKLPFKYLEETPNTTPEKIEFGNKLKREAYSQFLRAHFENLIVLTGAGSSVGWGGLTMKELWNKVETKLTSPVLEEFCKVVKFIGNVALSTLPESEKDLEKLLSKANTAKNFIETGFDIAGTIKICEQEIFTNCKISLKDDSPHETFLNKITNRKLKDPRVKIFTLNYDTLFEQAAINGNFTVIDGFSFSSPRTLSGRNFDYDIVYREKSRIKEEESFVPKVFHLYKPHGSVNWELNAKEQIVISEHTANPLMIYPKDSKYENSYDQPFFEMMSRFQQNLRKDNVLLICVGFSFNDKHIVTAIKEAVSQNPSFRLLIVIRTIRDSEELNWFVDKANKQYNVTVVAEEFSDFAQNYPSSKVYSDNQPLIPVKDGI